MSVLKVGWRVNMGEAEALVLVAAKTEVPVPKVLTAYTIGDIGFLTSKIEGPTIASCWRTCPMRKLQVIARQLASYISKWRQLGSSFSGSVNGGPCQDIL
ncbi:hypothetical protein ETB97_006363 [Aspergillus alliaceus]|uniref:Uncharacterized protein n=1 Tax=Petromyces alliaceus TaxID=209559 RepID=A0A8H6EBJ7_PETAA|nr:hypothetical protein ETB97_006363 [Aspergillus burnettii]